MRAQINSLENEVFRLKGLEPEVEWIQNMLKARDQEIAKGRQEQESLNVQASEVETTLCMVLDLLVDLTET
jgi:hypothetical protein